MRRAIELVSGLAAGVLGIAAVVYLTHPQGCDSLSSCRNLAGLLPDKATADFLIGIAALAGLAAVASLPAIGSYLHVARGKGSGIGLQWLGAMLLLATCVYLPHGGVALVPATLLACDAAIMGALPDRPAGDHDRARRVPGLVLALPTCLGSFILSVFALVALMAVSGDLDRPQLWEIPQGYRGWVVVEYDNLAYPPLPSAGLDQVIQVPPDGRVCTSTPMPTGWVFTRYQYVYSDGRREEVPDTGWGGGGYLWGGFSGRKQQSRAYPREAFFVGSEQDYRSGHSPASSLDDAHWPGCGITGKA
jgi:hypothetical protein